MELEAIVLAGGKSSRMGTDKALIKVGDVSLLQQVCLLAQAVATTVYLVTPWREKYQEIIPPGCQIIEEDTSTERFPLKAFVQGLTHIKTDWVLLLACDLPNLEIAAVQQWVNSLEQVSPEAIALLPRHPKGWEPLCGFYHRRSLPLLQDYLTKGGHSFQKWLAENPVQELTVGDFRQLFNCNTPADFAMVKQGLQKDN